MQIDCTRIDIIELFPLIAESRLAINIFRLIIWRLSQYTNCGFRGEIPTSRVWPIEK